MPTDFAFRLSTYLTLALGCICLGYSEWDYLPEVSFFTGVVTILMVVAFFRADRRGNELSLVAANRLGAVIGAIAVIWIVIHYRRPDSLINTLPWPAGGLPFLAPLLMILVPAKLFRPKHVGDWWALQGVGLVSVGLASSLCEDLGFVVLVTLYCLTGVWSLTLFYIRRASGHVPLPPVTVADTGFASWVSPASWFRAMFPPRSRPTVAEPFAGIGRPSPTERLGRSHFFRSVRWLAVGVVVALPLFFLTPRSSSMQWELFKSRLETGSSDAPDLSRTGELRVNSEPAFEVFARNSDGSPMNEIPADQRWRVAAYTEYQYPQGKWSKGGIPRVYVTSPEQPIPYPDSSSFEYPKLWDKQYRVEFRIVGKIAGAPVSDPADYLALGPPPIVHETATGFRYWGQMNDGSFSPLGSQIGRPTTYWQIVHERNANGEEPLHTFKLAEPFQNQTDPRTKLTAFPQENRIGTLANQWIDRWIAESRLPAEIRTSLNPITLKMNEIHHERVARAFRDHLAYSGEFEYTLNLKRKERKLDPIEDFLFNTKSGHCERFAAALVMLLRSVGIPAQFVLGYKGRDWLDDGHYVIKQEHAHAWAEVLVSRPSTDEKPGSGNRDWLFLSLDPTPDITSTLDATDGGVFSAGREGRRLFANYIIGLNAESQKVLTKNVSSFFEKNIGWLVAFAIVLAIIGFVVRNAIRRTRQSRDTILDATPADPVPWYAQMIAILTANGHAMNDGETPNEYADRVAERLKLQPETASVADVPTTVTQILYDVRYAQRDWTDERKSIVERAIRQLATTLSKSV